MSWRVQMKLAWIGAAVERQLSGRDLRVVAEAKTA
jgi:hypothetical protein